MVRIARVVLMIVTGHDMPVKACILLMMEAGIWVRTDVSVPRMVAAKSGLLRHRQ
jgi:hypothetical protein